MCVWVGVSSYFAILTRAILFTTTLIAGHNDFSIIEKDGKVFLFLGPVAYMNHGKLDTHNCTSYFVWQIKCADCDANCRILRTRTSGCHVITTKTIARGEEMTISYGQVCLLVCHLILCYWHTTHTYIL